jgi:hypothetical protein
VELILSKNLVYRGDFVQITVKTNFTWTVVSVVDALGNTLYNQNWTIANGQETRTIPITDTSPFGDYAVTALTPSGLATTKFTVVDTTNFVQTTFPYVKKHKGVDYVIHSNGTVSASINADNIIIDLSTLRAVAVNLGLTVEAKNNSMVFWVRFSKSVYAVDLKFIFVYSGCKFVINGTLNKAYSFEIDIHSKVAEMLKDIRNGIKQGVLTFDFTDVDSSGLAYSYNSATKKLTISVAETFVIDPYIFADGFESGDTSRWTAEYKSSGETLTVITDMRHHGSYGLQAYANGGAVGEYAYVQQAITSQDPCYVRVYYRFNAFPAAGAEFIVSPQLRYSTATGYRFAAMAITNVAGTCKWKLYYKTGDSDGTVTVDSPLPQINTWYSVEVGVDIDNSTGWARLWIDGTQVAEATGLDNNNPGAGVLIVQVGERYSSSAFEHYVYVDCAVIDDTYIGAEATPSFSDGFESGDTSTWTGTVTTTGETVKITQWDAYTGTYKFESASNGGGGTEKANVYKNVTSYPSIEMAARTYVYFLETDLDDNGDFFTIMFVGSYSGDEEYIAGVCLWKDSGITKWGVRYLTGDNTWGSTFTTSNQPVENQWYCVELYVLWDSYDGQALLYVDGDIRIIVSGQDFDYYTPSGKVYVGVRPIGVQRSITAYFDTVAVSNVNIGTTAQSTDTFPSFADDFENGSTSAWTTEYTTDGGTISVIGTNETYNGTYYGYFVSGGKAIGAGYCLVRNTPSITLRELYVREYVYFESISLPDVDDRIGLIIGRDDGNLGNIIFNARIYNSAGTVKFNLNLVTGTTPGYSSNFVTTPLPQEGQWYCIEVWWKMASAAGQSDGQAKMWIDGTEVVTKTSLDNDYYGDVDTVEMGIAYTYSCQNPQYIKTEMANISRYAIGEQAGSPTYYNWTMQGKDVLGTNIPRILNFKGTFSNETSFDVNSSLTGVTTIQTFLGIQTLEVWWGTHLVSSSQDVNITGTTITNVYTLIRRLNSGSYYTLWSLNNTSIPQPVYSSDNELRLLSVTSTGTIQLKVDHANWAKTTQPSALEWGSQTVTSSGWTWSSSILTYTGTFSTKDVILKWTTSSDGTQPPDGGTINPPVQPPAIPDTVILPTIPKLEPPPSLMPTGSMLPQVDLTLVGGVLIGVAAIIVVYSIITKKSIASLWASKRSSKSVTWKKPKQKTPSWKRKRK